MTHSKNVVLALWLGLLAVTARADFQFGGDPTTGTDPSKISLPKKNGTLLNIRGETAVNGNSGALSFTYAVPIPKWRGLLPALALRYDSQAGNGVFGYGMALTLPRLELSRQFGVPQGGSPLTSSEDGELSPVDAPSGMPPGQYFRSRVEATFHLYRREHGRLLMFNGNGTTYVFGATADAREEQGNLTSAWLLSSIEDPSGNKVEFTYYPQKGSGVALLRAIVCIDREGTAPYATFFTYEDRPDVWLSYRAGIAQTFSKRVRDILVFGSDGGSSANVMLEGDSSGLKRISRVTLHYKNPASGVSQRSLVETIERVGASDTDTTPATTFAYSSDQIGAGSVTGTYAVKDGPVFSPATASWLDFNGDGLIDLLGFDATASEWRVWLNQGGSQPFSSWRRLPFQNFALSDVNHVILDLNGDRRADLLFQDQAYINDPTTGMWSSTPVQVTGLPNASPGDQKLGTFVDLNGDSRTDYIEYVPSLDGLQLKVYPNESAGGKIHFGTPYLIDHGALPTGTGDTVQWADTNGDGLPDAVQSVIGIDSFDINVFINTGGHEFAGPRTMSVSPSPGNRKFRMADVNGDGIVDLIFGDHYSMAIYLGTGSGFVLSDRTFPDELYANALMFEVADINGNGSTDLITATENNQIKFYDPYASQTVAVPFIMTDQSTALGEHNHYSYASSFITYRPDQILRGGLPTLQQLVTESLQTAPTSTPAGGYANMLTKHVRYNYGGGAYDPVRNEFLGHAHAEVQESHQAQVGAQSGDFNHGLLTATDYYTTENSGLLKGKVRLTTTTGLGSHVVYKTVETPFSLKQLFAGKEVYLPLIQETRTTNREDDGSSRTVRVRTCTRLYEPVMVPGDRVETTFDGRNQPYRRVHTTFLSPGPSWLVQKATRLELLPAGDGSTPIEGKTISYHATHCGLREIQQLRGGKYILKSRYGYTDSGLVSSVTDAGGGQTSIDYESSYLPSAVITRPSPGSELVKKFTWDLAKGGIIADVTDENGHKTVYAYDGLGRLASVQSPGVSDPQLLFSYIWGTPATPSKIATHSLSIDKPSVSFYDGLQRPFASTAPHKDANSLDGYKVFDLGASTSIESASIGGVEADPPWTLNPARLTKRQFDDLGRPVRESVPVAGGVTGSYDALGQSVPKGTRLTVRSAMSSITYDEEGIRREQKIDELERVVGTAVVDADPSLSTSIAAKYDEGDRLREIQIGSLPRRTYDYDQTGHLTGFSSKDIGHYEWDYTVSGQLEATRLFDVGGHAVASRFYAYDATNREIERRVLDGEATTILLGWSKSRSLFKFHYDSPANDGVSQANLKGRLAWRQIGTGAAYKEAYDERGNLITETLAIGNMQFKLSTDYDVLDRVKKIVYPNGKTIGYTYSPLTGSLDTVPPLIEEIQRDDVGRAVNIRYAGGIALVVDYEPVIGHITHQELTGKSGALADYTYSGFDALQRFTAFHGTDLANSALDKAFSYDSRGQLKHAVVTIQPKTQPAVAYDSTYLFDSNALATSIGGTALTYQRRPDTSLQAIQYGNQFLKFGAMGLMESSSNLSKAVWSGGEQMACQKTTAGERTWFDYQPDGSIFAEVVGKGDGRRTTIFMGRFGEVDLGSGAWTNHYYVENQRLASEDDKDRLRINVLDPQQTLHLAVYPDSTLASSREQTPWGESLSEQRMTGQKRGFLGAIYNRDADLHHLVTRDYFGSMGMFVRPDEHILQNPEECLKSPLECNLISYGQNNPLLYVDTKGKSTEGEPIAIAHASPAYDQFNFVGSERSSTMVKYYSDNGDGKNTFVNNNLRPILFGPGMDNLVVDMDASAKAIAKATGAPVYLVENTTEGKVADLYQSLLGKVGLNSAPVEAMKQILEGKIGANSLVPTQVIAHSMSTIFVTNATHDLPATITAKLHITYYGNASFNTPSAGVFKSVVNYTDAIPTFFGNRANVDFNHFGFFTHNLQSYLENSPPAHVGQ